jgi:hypothetical protein
MRTSILTRSAVAVATLAVGSAVLVAAPAQAATTNGITRAEVLAAANEARTSLSANRPTSSPAITALASKACGVPLSGVSQAIASPVDTPDSVDGVAVSAFLVPETDSEESPTRTCTFAAGAAVGSGTSLSGEAIVATYLFDGRSITPSLQSLDLSGDVFASSAVMTTTGFVLTSFGASGLATGQPSKRVVTLTKKFDKKSKADKKAAKKAYVKRLKAAKKAYAKALKKAGSSRSKKSAARAAYTARRSSAKQAYSYAIADYKYVKTRTKQADSVRFSVSADNFGGLA